MARDAELLKKFGVRVLKMKYDLPWAEDSAKNKGKSGMVFTKDSIWFVIDIFDKENCIAAADIEGRHRLSVDLIAAHHSFDDITETYTLGEFIKTPVMGMFRKNSKFQVETEKMKANAAILHANEVLAGCKVMEEHMSILDEMLYEDEGYDTDKSGTRKEPNA